MKTRFSSFAKKLGITLGAFVVITLGQGMHPMQVFSPQVSQAASQGIPRQPAAGELLRAIERLAVVGNVLYVAAHPDDENTRLLSYLHGERLFRTAYLSLTRGDGGQNLIGTEQGPLLGLVRTQELLAARRLDGAEQFFTRARDFGYSKSAAETLSIWNKDQVLADLVWVVRRFRPDVILTRFSTQGGDTHGHHTASAILAEEAFRVAADPTFHPEQLKHASVWQAKRIYWNRSVWGGSKPSDDMLSLPKLDSGGYNAALGLSYGELAADSRSMHKSQGFGATRTRGSSWDYFQSLQPSDKSPAVGSDIFSGLDFSWERVPGGSRLAQLLRQAAAEFNPRHPEASIPTLLQARSELLRLPDNPYKEAKLQDVAEIIAACAGLFLEATAADHVVVPGGSATVTAVAMNRSAAALKLEEVRYSSGVTVPAQQALNHGQAWQAERPLIIPQSASASGPYWLAEAPDKGAYTVADQKLIGLPENPAALRAQFVISAAGQAEPLILERPVSYKWTDPVAGERTRALEVTPAVMLTPESPVLMFPDGQPRPLRVLLKAGKDKVAGTAQLELPSGFASEPASIAFSIDKKGAEQELKFLLRPPALSKTSSVSGTVKVVASVDGQKLSRSTHHIDYPHIPIQALFPEASVKLVRLDLKKTRAKIGYIAGAGDEVPAALRQVGFDVTMLSDETLSSPTTADPLRQFGAIVIGVRAFNTNQRLPFYHQRLMNFVAAGGNLIVQYNTSNRLGKLSAPIGPHPFEISQERVTDENAAVTWARPDHPLQLRPNRLSEGDFADWVQERGLYFAGTWDEKYETPLMMNDPGEPPRKGSVLIARHGKGAFFYTGLSFFRQLPAGVAGAYRLLANMISYGS